MTETITLSTQDRYQLLNITDQVEAIVEKSGVREGSCLVFARHSTAAIIQTENEPGLVDDWLKFLKKLVDNLVELSHNRIDDNADSHLLSGLIGQGRTIPIENGKLLIGPWQQIFFVELDGPRSGRKAIVTVSSLLGSTRGPL